MTEPKLPFELTTEEKHSALWRRLTEHWQSRLNELRVQNDSDLCDTLSAKLRGRIAEVKANLALGKDKLNLD